jgi:hypothetical protein
VSTGDVNFDILADYRPLPLDTSNKVKVDTTSKKKPHVVIEGRSTP